MEIVICWEVSVHQKIFHVHNFPQINVLPFYDKSRQLLRKIYAPLLIDTLWYSFYFYLSSEKTFTKHIIKNNHFLCIFMNWYAAKL